MALRWRRRWRSLLSSRRLIASASLAALLLWASLPYDNAVRLSVRFNAHQLLSLLPPWPTSGAGGERWLRGEPAFPVDWAHDVAIVLKTGYGTQERVAEWFGALPAAVNPESVLVVGDFESVLEIGGGGGGGPQPGPGLQPQPQTTPPPPPPRGVRVHDVVAEVLEGGPHPQCRAEGPCPRLEKYRTLRAAISAGEDELARNLSGTFGWELDAVKFLPALGLAYRSMPPKKWYILLDDDTYLVQPSLNALLGRLDPSTPYYLGNAVGDYRLRFAHGGSSITLSRATMRELFGGGGGGGGGHHDHHDHHDRPHHENRVLADARRASAAGTEALGDRLLAGALLRLGVHVEESTGRLFNGEQPRASRLRRDRFCSPVSTFHRLGAAGEMARVGRALRLRDAGAGAGAGAGADGPVLWVDIWDIFHGRPSLATAGTAGHEGDGEGDWAPRRRWDHVGRLDEHTVTVAGVGAAPGCSGLCGARSWCLAWTWEEGPGLCHLSPWVTIGVEAGGKVSGLHEGRVRSLAGRCR